MPIIKECLECGMQFKVDPYRKNTAKFCSTNCKKKSQIKKTIKKNCLYCRGKMEGKPFEIEKKQYCNSKCFSSSRKSTRKKTTKKIYPIKSTRKKTTKKICPICKEQFDLIYSKRNRFHCSLKCRKIARTTGKTIICIQCGGKKYCPKWHLDMSEKHGKFCSNECTNQYYSREKNHFYIHGKGHEPYTPDFNKRFKLLIRKRDNFSCQLCNIYEQDHIKLHNRVLLIHHIDYNKLNSFPQNCITLCERCHGMTNNNRDYWTNFLQSLLLEKYNYQYISEQKLIVDFTIS